MPSLQVRNLPQDLNDKLADIAVQEGRSLARETIVLLRTALDMKTHRQAERREVLEKIRRLHWDNADAFPSPAQLLREDRER